ncbi:MarR family winged helix-turn-helix transcriptional regulator [Micromonospora zhanjiangensis]|uniref:MarR family winged helix-turn-helix transcriptional regulator n=1 Tax=Micromonospora zhanjiangensis TaxID=1522057 RepID=A0ABV8KS24_9ACTN
MNGVDLFRLGRALTRIGEAALPVDGLPEYPGGHRAVLIVIADLEQHGESAVGEIARRTGLPQSAVSGAVARLREAKAVELATDPRDRRRSLVRPSAEPSERQRVVAASTIDAAVADALGPDRADEVAETVAMLAELGRRLAPSNRTEPDGRP